MTTQQKTVQSAIRTSSELKIVGGPSKDDIQAALFDREGLAKRVEFVADPGNGFANLGLEAQIESVTYLYGDRSSWAIKGVALDPRGTVACRNWRQFEASFNTKTRQGTFKYITKGVEGV